MMKGSRKLSNCAASNQVDQQRRQQEHPEKPAALRPELPRLPRVVNREALGQGGAGFLFEEAQRLIERDGRRDDALDADGIQLLELLQFTRLGGRSQAGKRRERNQLVIGPGDVHLLQLICRQTLVAFELWNHLVAAALDAEPVDVIAAHQCRQIESRLSQVDALRSELVAIEDDFNLRLVELDVGVGKDEQAAGERLLHELAGELAKPLGFRRPTR